METGWGEQGAWTVAWRQAKTGRVIEFLEPQAVDKEAGRLGLPPGPRVVFAMSGTAEEAMERAEGRLKGDPFFRRRWANGAFFPVPYHLGIFVPESPHQPLLIFPDATPANPAAGV